MPDERRLIEELDKAVEAIMRYPGEATARVTTGVGSILGIVANLRGLPRDAFRARLGAELQRAARDMPTDRRASTERS